jgi:hypothetical protein
MPALGVFMARETSNTIGRTKAVLTVGRHPNQKAVIITLNAERTHKENPQLTFKGVVNFSKPIKDHVEQIIIPIINRILEDLGVPRPGLVISATNLGIASVSDVGVDISGFSADTGIFLILLSRCLGVPLADDVVTTGHISSPYGDITLVKGIPVKLEAAILNPSVHRFIYPDPDRDGSLKVLSPDQRDDVVNAVMGARDDIKTKAVKGISDLLKVLLTEEALVLASLRQGFFGSAKLRDTGNNPVSDVVCFLTHANETRLWRVLHGLVLHGQGDRARSLLQAFCEFYLNKRTYPRNFGKKLYRFVCGLPPSIRLLDEFFPLIDTGLCIRLCRYAAQSDHPDVLCLYDAAHGRNLTHNKSVSPAPIPHIAETSDLDCLAFDRVTSKISEQAMAHKFGIPADSARGSFVLESSTVQSWEQFIEILQSFFIHLHSYITSEAESFIDLNRARAEVLALLEEAFQIKGGTKAAFARAEDGTDGGLRSVLDTLTEHYKSKRLFEYIQCVFKDAVDPLDWDDRVRFINGALKRLRPLLPRDIRDEPPERFVGAYEMIVQAYVQSLDQVNKVLRTL